MHARLHEQADKLHAFAAVARAGSLSRAAGHLNTSQAALSHAMKVLEVAAGASLFHREHRGMRLTGAGKILFEFSKRLEMDLETLEVVLTAPGAADAGRLRVGTHETLAIHVWPEVLESLAKRLPNVAVSLMSGRIDALVQGLHNGEFHMVVGVEPRPDPRLAVEALYSGTFGFFGAASGPSSIPRAAIDDIPILTDALAHLRQDLPIPRFLAQLGLRLERFFELSSFEAAINLAARGLGLAFLPQRNAEPAVRAGRLKTVAVAGLGLSRQTRHVVCATWAAGEGPNPLREALLTELRTPHGAERQQS